jgi:hypothetical protein
MDEISKKEKVCTSTFPPPIFHFIPYMGQSEKCTEAARNVNI